jgi:septal ring factor EnvC (AmiA/AmiB activator)
MNIDPVHLAARSGTAEEAQKVLNELEAEFAAVKHRRDAILVDISKANAASVRDQQARLKLPGLNKEEAAAGRLIRSIEMQVKEAKKRVAMAANQAAAARAAVPIAEGAERLFLVNTPHHLHQVRHKARTIEELRSRLLPGYTVEGQIFGANDAGEGGVVAAIDPKGPSIMEGLLAAFGDELIAFLAERGIVGSDKQAVVVLPANNRESMQ